MRRAILIVLLVSAFAAEAEQLPPPCLENSPERRGEEGCTILASKPLHGAVTNSVYWHVDRFDSLEAAKKAAGPDGVAAEAHGSAWLMTVEAQAREHPGGRHITWIGPLPMPPAASYSMQVMSTLFRPGTASGVHTHPGPEVFYVVAGEQCLETPEGGHSSGAGQAYVVPAGVTMRVRATGLGLRRALVLILHDAAHPAMHGIRDPPLLVGCTARTKPERTCDRSGTGDLLYRVDPSMKGRPPNMALEWTWPSSSAKESK
jgi:quercetin dioxygenase-like cupin family protein